ncbi:MAG: hypothetical protein AB1479_03980 [Pseudomonadota bacterium]
MIFNVRLEPLVRAMWTPPKKIANLLILNEKYQLLSFQCSINAYYEEKKHGPDEKNRKEDEKDRKTGPLSNF